MLDESDTMTPSCGFGLLAAKRSTRRGETKGRYADARGVDPLQRPRHVEYPNKWIMRMLLTKTATDESDWETFDTAWHGGRHPCIASAHVGCDVCNRPARNDKDGAVKHGGHGEQSSANVAKCF